MTRFLMLLLIAFASIQFVRPPEVPKTAVLALKWNKAYPDDTIDKSAIGLEWALSYCGAMLPNAPYAIAVGTDEITVQLAELGFGEAALQKMQLLHQKIKQSDEYKANKNIDLGRYITLLLGASEHYYEIAGVPKHLDLILAQYELDKNKGYLNNSAVSNQHRLIQFSDRQHVKQVFIASEIDSVTGKVHEFETIEIMANNQLRFGIFDADGNRINSADPVHSNAGKPAKCMWCHESNILPLFKPQKDFSGFLTFLQLKQQLADDDKSFNEQKMTLKTGVDFLKKTQHTNAELLYISFMEPSAERLSLEWKMPVEQVQRLLSGLPTHVYPEFPFLGTLYDRKAVEPFAPHKGLPFSSSVRERSDVEVNHLN